MIPINTEHSRVRDISKGDVVYVRVYNGPTDGYDWVEVVAVHTRRAALQRMYDANLAQYKKNPNKYHTGLANMIDKVLGNGRWNDATSAIIEVKGTPFPWDSENFILTRQLNIVEVQV